MLDDEKRYTFDRVVRLMLGAITAVALFLLVRYLADVLIPFAAALVLAYLINPLVTLFAQKTGRRGLAVSIVLGGLFIVVATVIAILIPVMAHQISRFSDDLASLRSGLEASRELTPEDLPVEEEEEDAESPEGQAMPAGGQVQEDGKDIGFSQLAGAWNEYRRNRDMVASERLLEFRRDLEGTYFADLFDYAVEYMHGPEFGEQVVRWGKGLFYGGVSLATFAIQVMLGLIGLIIVAIYLVFLLLDYPNLQKSWKSFLPPKQRDSIVGFLEEFNLAMRRYFRGQFIVACAVGVLFTIGFWLIGLPMAIPLGIFIGALNMVPYLQTVGLVPALLLAVMKSIQTGSSLVVMIILTLAVFAVVQTLDATLITPRVMGRVTGLRPVAVLLGVFIWGKLLGFLGLIVAIPLTCLGIAYYRRLILRQSKEQAAVIRKDEG